MSRPLSELVKFKENTMRLVVLIAVVVLWSPVASAQSSVFLEDLTWTEVRDALTAGRTTVIVPTGGTEQNGPHMVLGKHNLRVRFAAGEIAKRLGNVLVAPVMAYVPEGDVAQRSGHMWAPGTITLPPEHFAKVVEFAARSFQAHGFLDVVLIGDSGPNQPSLKLVADTLNREWASSAVRVHHLDKYYDDSEFGAWFRAQGYSEEVVGTHAGLSDTSMQLAVDPSGVRISKLAPGRQGDGSGVNGDPTRATADYGRKGLELSIDGAVRQFRELRESSRKP